MIDGVYIAPAPAALVPGERLLEPAFFQIVLLGVTQHVRLNGGAIDTYGKGAEPASLLGIIVLHEAEATAAHVGIILQHTLHDAHHFVRLVETVFNDGSIIDGSHIEVGRDAANLLVFALHNTVADDGGPCVDDAITHPEYEECGYAHDNQHTQHDAPREPLGKGACIARLGLFLEDGNHNLFIVCLQRYNFFPIFANKTAKT